MQYQHPDLTASQALARDGSIAPVWFAWIRARNRTTNADEFMGLWTGDDDITINVQTPEGALASRQYLGGCNLSVSGIQYVMDLTDRPITVSMSQIAPATQQLVRGYDVRLAYCEIHATTWTGGRLTAAPDLQWVGIVDDAPVGTPQAGSDGDIRLSVRSEIMHQLTAINPAKSSDAHQRRRFAGDGFSRYSGIAREMKIKWYHKK